MVTALEGSLSGAARQLKQTQPTLSRQVAALEKQLGVTLFERVGKRLVLSETGADLLEHLRSMSEAAALVTLGATGRSQAIVGQVRISAGEVVAAYLLPPIVDAPTGSAAPHADADVRTAEPRRSARFRPPRCRARERACRFWPSQSATRPGAGLCAPGTSFASGFRHALAETLLEGWATVDFSRRIWSLLSALGSRRAASAAPTL